MKYILDTNIISESIRPEPNRNVLNWLIANSAASAISVVTLGEVWQGIEMLDEGKRKNGYTRWFNSVKDDFLDSLIPLDLEIMKVWGSYCASLKNKGIKPAVIDSLIASTAICKSAVIVTRNIDDFPDVETINPF